MSKKRPSKKDLERRKKAVAALLAKGKTPTEVATITGEHRPQIARWQKEPEFKELIETCKMVVDALETQLLPTAIPPAISAPLVTAAAPALAVALPSLATATGDGAYPEPTYSTQDFSAFQHEVAALYRQLELVSATAGFSAANKLFAWVEQQKHITPSQFKEVAGALGTINALAQDSSTVALQLNQLLPTIVAIAAESQAVTEDDEPDTEAENKPEVRADGA